MHPDRVTRTAVAAVLGFLLWSGPDAEGSHRPGVRRHHGLGEGYYCHFDGVRRYHGLGDGHCYRSYRGGGYSPYVLPYRVVVVEPGYQLRHESSHAPLAQPGVGVGLTSPAAQKLPRGRRAWVTLVRGEARAALREFAVLSLRDPRDAAARTGYGLAAAALGRHETAAWALRRAVVTDAAGFEHLAIDAAGRDLVRRLLAYYARTASEARDRDPVDALFMVSALCVLLDDLDTARSAITIVLERDGADPAAKILHDLLGPADEVDELLPVAMVAGA